MIAPRGGPRWRLSPSRLSPLRLRLWLVQEELHLPEQLQAVLLEHHQVGGLADLDEAASPRRWSAWRRAPAECGGVQAIPLGGDDQRGRRNPGRVVERLASVPVVSGILERACGLRTTGGVRAAPTGSVASVAAVQASNHAAGASAPPASPAGHPPGGARGPAAWSRSGRPGSARGAGGRRRGADPPRRVEDEAVDLVGILAGIPAHQVRAPRPADQADPGQTPLAQDVLHRHPQIAHRHNGRGDRRAVGRRPIHLRRLRGPAEAAHVHEPHVPSVLGEVVHPGLPPAPGRRSSPTPGWCRARTSTVRSAGKAVMPPGRLFRT